MSSKSDIDAKEAYKTELKKEGYKNIKTIKTPADIKATKDGEDYYFEIKWTEKEKYFGAATLTEWEAAYKNPNNYFFVICQKTGSKKYNFFKLKPDDLEKFSTVPPFKFFFYITLPFNKNVLKKESTRPNKALRLNKDRFDALNKLYKKLKSN